MVCAVKQARNKDDSTDKRHQGQREAETRQVVPGCVERELGRTSRGGRHLRLPLRFGLRPQGPCRVGAARLLCGLLCPPVKWTRCCPSWPRGHQWCGSHPGGGQPGCGPRGLPQEEARGKGLAWALTPRQVFVSTESIVNPGVSLPCSVGCCFLIFINAYFNLNLRLIPVQFHVENF